MTQNKENAKNNWCDMVLKSWTYARLTTDERNRLTNAISRTKFSGTYRQRCEVLNAVYYAFMLGLGYNGPEWRETDTTAPLF